MIKISKSNVFNVNADAIVNTINCVGFMGKGLALEFSLRYPDLLKEYQEECKMKKIQIGKMFFFHNENIKIINFPTKYDYKFPSQLKWIQMGLEDFVKNYKNYNAKRIAFPLLGCSNGGLDRKIVYNLMNKYLSNLDVEIIICLNEINPEGKELEMLRLFKTTSIENLSFYVKLNSKQKLILKENQNTISRFFELSKLEGIGKTTYEKIFRLFYDNNFSIDDNKENQLSLF